MRELWREDSAAFDLCAQALHTMPPMAAGLMSLALGGEVEDGRSPKQSGREIVALFTSWMNQLPQASLEDESEEIADEEAPEIELTEHQNVLLEALLMLSRSVVAHLARMPEYRAALSNDQAFMDQVDHLQTFTYAATWVHTALLKESNDLLLLDMVGAGGAHVRYENVANCFHLFTLIQCVIGKQLTGGHKPKSAVFKAARNESDVEVNDAAWWHYGNPHDNEPNITSSIWGEGSVSSIPRIDELQVILLWPLILNSRTWDGGFFSPRLEAMMPSIQVEAILSPTECEPWLKRLNLKVRN